jgi:hypothetical protein
MKNGDTMQRNFLSPAGAKYAGLVFVFAAAAVSFASESVSGRGYLSYLNTVSAQDRHSPWLVEGTVHSRLDAVWHAAQALSFTGALRTRLLYGDFVEQVPDYTASLSRSRGYFRLSRVIDEGRSWLLHSEIDRLYAEATAGKLQVRLGRHRINWGMNLAWNPNDLFNTYSLFEVDYPERPGSDALLFEYYPSPSSDAQLVWKAADRGDSMALAALYRCNYRGYDVQGIAGVVENDLVAGCGWAGQVRGGGFRGEMTWFHSLEDAAPDAVSASVSGDYTFSCNLYAHAAVLYTSSGSAAASRAPASMDELLSLSAKKLSTSRYSCFGQLAYPVTPLVNAEIMAVVNPVDFSLYVNPSLRISVADDWELTLMAQVFEGRRNTEFGGYGVFGMGRLRWSF